MLKWVYRNPKFDKQMDSLKRKGKKASIAAKKAEEIINKITNGAVPEQSGSLTRYGELRLFNGLKFDLGCGYRLIASKQEDQFFILFIGTHDECNRWLENNKHWRPDLIAKKGAYLSVETVESEPDDNPSENLETEEPDDSLDHIDEKYLRLIFHALCD